MIEFAPAPATLPAGQRVYAIGDIHGCLEPLDAVHRMIAQDLADRPVATATLVHLGDYVDRGPDSAEVIGRLINGPAIAGVSVVNLMGNHEEMALHALSSGRSDEAEQWMRNGGADTLLSWRVPRTAPNIVWPVLVPFDQQKLLRGLALTHRIGPYFFVHAGIRPGVALDRQKTEDLLWIREPFLSFKKDHGVVVVHGHTPVRDPVVRSNRIGIDTGAVLGGNLTCAVLENDKVGFLRTQGALTA